VQTFDVRLLDAGANRLPVLARVRPLMRRPPAECLALVEAGAIVARDLIRPEAEALAAALRALGALVEIQVSKCGCSGADPTA
jgi:ribosomal protein L7/L12